MIIEHVEITPNPVSLYPPIELFNRVIDLIIEFQNTKTTQTHFDFEIVRNDDYTIWTINFRLFGHLRMRFKVRHGQVSILIVGSDNRVSISKSKTISNIDVVAAKFEIDELMLMKVERCFNYYLQHQIVRKFAKSESIYSIEERFGWVGVGILPEDTNRWTNGTVLDYGHKTAVNKRGISKNTIQRITKKIREITLEKRATKYNEILVHTSDGLYHSLTDNHMATIYTAWAQLMGRVDLSTSMNLETYDQYGICIARHSCEMPTLPNYRGTIMENWI